MKISHDGAGRIDRYGIEVPDVEGLTVIDVPDAVVPVDFASTTGKYKVDGGAIVEIEGWVPPTPAEDLPPGQRVTMEDMFGQLAERDATIAAMKAQHREALDARDRVISEINDMTIDNAMTLWVMQNGEIPE